MAENMGGSGEKKEIIIVNEKSMNTALFKLIRPKQWIKNTFVFLPIFFGGSLLDGGDVLAGILTFFAFCFALLRNVVIFAVEYRTYKLSDEWMHLMLSKRDWQHTAQRI